MSHHTDRRQFLQAGALAGVGFWVSGSPAADSKAANDRLNIAVIGCGGRGRAAVGGARKHNLVALCDVDDKRAAKAFEDNPSVPKFRDFRKMFDGLHKQIDAVFVATPDHTHAVAAVTAMRLG